MQNSINASMRIVPDTMILVHLARLGLLNEKLKTFTEILLPQMVFDEATSGKERYPDAQIIEDTLKEAENVRIMSSDYQKTSLETLGLQKGGREAVSLYLEKEADFLFSNDPIFRSLAPLLRINVADTASVIVDQVRRKQLSRNQAIKKLQQLKSLVKYSNLYIEGIIRLLEDGYFG